MEVGGLESSERSIETRGSTRLLGELGWSVGSSPHGPYHMWTSQRSGEGLVTWQLNFTRVSYLTERNRERGWAGVPGGSILFMT